MARVLLIGKGPLPGPGVERTSFAQHRLAHFLRALGEAGHEVRLVELSADAPPVAGPAGWAGRVAVAEEGPGWIGRITGLAEGAHVIVSAGPYNPGRAACLAAGDLPVWVDVPGDPFAELQAVASAGGATPERVAAAQAAALPVFERADAISVISEPQRFAAIGQLGLAGRLCDPDTAERVFTIPVAWDFPSAPVRPRARRAGDPLVVALSGGLHAWFDHDTLIAGLDRAMDALPDLRLVCTGGVVGGQPDGGQRAFGEWAAKHEDRVTVTGWLPHAHLDRALAPCHVGLCLDRPGYEAALGSRTRVLWFAWMGLRVVATARTALVRELAHEGHVEAVPAGDPEALAATLVRLARHDMPASGPSEAADFLAERFDPHAIAAPLLGWVEHPTRLAPGLGLLGLAGAMAQELARLRSELASVHATPTWRALSRVDGVRRAVLGGGGKGGDRG